MNIWGLQLEILRNLVEFCDDCRQPYPYCISWAREFIKFVIEVLNYFYIIFIQRLGIYIFLGPVLKFCTFFGIFYSSLAETVNKWQMKLKLKNIFFGENDSCIFSVSVFVINL